MAVLELTASEGRLLESALHAYEQTLLQEIAHADARAFREMLRERETAIHSLMERVRAQFPPVAGNS